MKFFSSLFKASPVKEMNNNHEELLLCNSIPSHADPTLLNESYPKKILPLHPLPVSFFTQRYANEIQTLLSGLPFSEEELNAYLMPVIKYLIEFVNILPASEYHHHSDPGGLFLHSLQCAIYMVSQVEQQSFDNNDTYHTRYHNKKRWVLAAVITALTHDIGKVFDIHVSDEKGNLWVPLKHSLWSWSQLHHSQQIYLHWYPNRIHKTHEMRSLRLIYSQFLAKSLLYYLEEITNENILDAIDEAIVLNKGPLAKLLKNAEALSIAVDAENRKRLAPQITLTTSPLAVPLITVIRTLIESKAWTINKEDSAIFVTNKGVFLHLTTKIPKQIHELACKFNAPYLPSTIEGLCRCMVECASVEFNTSADKPSEFWAVEINATLGLRTPCLKLKDPLQLIPAGFMPTPLEVNLSVQNNHTSPILSPQRSSPSPTTVEDKTQQTHIKDESHPILLTESDLMTVTCEPLPTEELNLLMEQLFTTLKQQLLDGKGFLVEEVKQDEDRYITKSTKIEELLKNRKISTKTQEMLFRFHQSHTSIEFNPIEHLIIFNAKKFHETKPK